MLTHPHRIGRTAQNFLLVFFGSDPVMTQSRQFCEM